MMQVNQQPPADLLLLAGSQISFREIHRQEMSLPVHRGKFYATKDVDDLFVTMNGMFANISEQAFRSEKALTDARNAQAEAESENKHLSETLVGVQHELEQTIEHHQALHQEYQTVLSLYQELEQENHQKDLVIQKQHQQFQQLAIKAKERIQTLEQQLQTQQSSDTLNVSNKEANIVEGDKL